MRSNRRHHALDRIFDVSIRRPQRLAGAREFQQGIDEIGHLIHRDSNFLIKFLALIGRQPALAQKFRVGYDRRQRMPQIMRDRTGHPPDGGQALGFQQFLLRLLKGWRASG